MIIWRQYKIPSNNLNKKEKMKEKKKKKKLIFCDY